MIGSEDFNACLRGQIAFVGRSASPEGLDKSIFIEITTVEFQLN